MGNKLTNLLTGLQPGELSTEELTPKPISIRLPAYSVAKIDALAKRKGMSRNILVNEIMDAALAELFEKLHEQNPSLAAELESTAKEHVKSVLAELEPPPHPPHKHWREHA